MIINCIGFVLSILRKLKIAPKIKKIDNQKVNDEIIDYSLIAEEKTLERVFPVIIHLEIEVQVK